MTIVARSIGDIVLIAAVAFVAILFAIPAGVAAIAWWAWQRYSEA